MPTHDNTSDRFGHLRQLITQALGGADTADGGDTAPIMTVIDQLETSYRELETGNRALQQVRNEHEKLRQEFEDLYEFAPGGNATLNPKGCIKRINLTGTTILGLERNRLLSKRFRGFIDPQQQPSFVLALQQAKQTAEKTSLQVRLKHTRSDIEWIRVNIEAVHTRRGELLEYRLVFLDITLQKKAEAQLYEHERQLELANERLQIALDGGNMGIWDNEFTTGQVVWNERLYALLGLPPDTAITGDTFFEYIHPDDLPDIRARLKEVYDAGELFEADFRVVRPDGTERWLHSSGKLIRSVNGEPVRMSGINYDITDRRHAEQELEKNRILLNEIIDNTPALIYVKDLEGAIILANTAAAELFGLPREELIGKTSFDLHPHDLAAEHAENDARIIRTGTPSSFEEEAHLDEGTLTYYSIKFPLKDEQGNIVAVGGISSDITDIKRTEQELRDQNAVITSQVEELNAIYEGSPVGLCVLDHDLRYVRINRWLADLNGLPVEAHIGKPVAEVIPAFADEMQALYERMRTTGKPVFEYDLSHLSQEPDVDRFWLSNWIPQFGDDGEIRFIYCAIQDITDIVVVRREMARYTSLLTHALNQYPGMFSIWDRDGRLAFANKSWTSIFWKRIGMLVGESFENVYSKQYQKAIRKEFHAAFETADIQETITSHKVSGNELMYLHRFTPVADTDGNVDVVLDVGQEITRFEERRKSLELIHEQLESLVAKRTEELRLSNEELHESNTALNRLVDEYKRREHAAQQQIIEQLDSLVIPYLGKLERRLTDETTARYVRIIQDNLNEITLHYGRSMELLREKLSPMEFQVAHLIRTNYSTEQIAEILHIEPNTVFTHRRNIRKKLGIKQKDMNLQTYLMSIE